MSGTETANIKVNDIPKDWDESKLYSELLSRCPTAHIEFLQIPIDGKSGIPHGHAFIGVPSDSADFVVQCLNKETADIPLHAVIQNSSKTAENIVFFNNLSRPLIKEEFLEMLEPYGRNLDVNFRDYPNKTTATVNFDTREEAERAIKELNGKMFHSKVMKVDFFTSGHEAKGNRSIIVRNIPQTVPMEWVKKTFSSFGEIINFYVKEKDGKIECKHINDHEVYQACIDFENVTQAQTAIEGMNGYPIDDIAIEVLPRIPKNSITPDEQGCTLFLSNVKSLSADILRDRMKKFGTITKFTPKFNNDSSLKCILCTYADKGSAKAALDSNGMMISGVSIKISKYAPKIKKSK